MCENELNFVHQGFRKLSSDRLQTDRQTSATEIIYQSASRVVNNNNYTGDSEQLNFSSFCEFSSRGRSAVTGEFTATGDVRITSSSFSDCLSPSVLQFCAQIWDFGCSRPRTGPLVIPRLGL